MREGGTVAAAHFEDPFGNIIEIYTHNYETLYGGMKRGEKPETK
jgi:hypothetical protein